MSNPSPIEEIVLQHRLVDGMHFFTSPDVPGLCAAHKDRDLAAKAVGTQLADLLNARDAQDSATRPEQSGR